VNISNINETKDFIKGDYTHIKTNYKNDSKISALMKVVVEQFERYHRVFRKIPSEILTSVQAITDANKLADNIAANLNIKLHEKQELLEISEPSKRLDKIHNFLITEIDTMQVEKKIKGRVKRQMEKTQKEYYLNEQMKAIQKELGDNDDVDDIAELESKIEKLNLTSEAKEKCKNELKKLKNMSPMSAEATVIRNYLDWVLTIPWSNPSQVSKNINKAKTILENDHYGLDKVKDRIIEYLAVQKRINKIKGPILC